MTNLEHLIENGLEAIKELRYDDWMRLMAKDINLPETDTQLDDLWEICQYIQYSYIPCFGQEKIEWTYVKDALPPHSGKLDKRGVPMSIKCLCAIVGDTKEGRHFFVKEGYCVTYEDGDVHWRVPGSQSNVYAWMPLPAIPEAPEFMEDKV